VSKSWPGPLWTEPLKVDPSKHGDGVITRRRALAVSGGLAAAFSGATRALPREEPNVQDDVAAGIEKQRRMTTMQITRSGSQPSQKGPTEYFTGSVRIDSRFQGGGAARIGGATVTFEPGARTAWHTHPLGQTLIVTSGCGWVQSEGGPKEEVRPGDIVWFPPDEKHWHGATATTAMTHIAIAEALDGKSVDWLEKVTDEQYGK